MNSLELVKEAVRLLDDKKAQDITVLNIKDLTSLGDYFVIASADNTTLVTALAEELELRLKEKGTLPKRVEGARSSLWILLDYYDVIIHIFYGETREFYALERLWSDAPREDTAKLLAE